MVIVFQSFLLGKLTLDWSHQKKAIITAYYEEMKREISREALNQRLLHAEREGFFVEEDGRQRRRPGVYFLRKEDALELGVWSDEPDM